MKFDCGYLYTLDFPEMDNQLVLEMPMNEPDLAVMDQMDMKDDVMAKAAAVRVEYRSRSQIPSLIL